MKFNTVEIIAHRGASHDAPENTVSSFKLGWQQNADACELDIRLSCDGRIVVIHDTGTKRTAGVDKKVSEQTFDELRTLDSGSWKGSQWKGEKIPTLAQALATIPDGKRFFIEIKCGAEALPEMEKVIKASGKKPQQLPLITFYPDVAKQSKQKFPDHDVLLLYDWKPDKITGKTLSVDELIAKVREMKLDGVDVKDDPIIDAGLVKKFKDAGLKFYVWTVDDAEAAKKLVSCGVDGITTNRPSWLREQIYRVAFKE
ncbi:MAG TPA: glycerophosphodiester phosphodiesterase [Lentisphaeria bacterium]|nr:MAG: hypothetical protein A2X48_10030 [Lentisphaerae bacterium GWF2_49_21]HBC88105.1 glycerophosphodiester phosphodiesterase [Lentisphaeria bacterium]